MSEYIIDRAMYRRAAAVVAELERRVKIGAASDVERARYRRGLDHMLIFEWASDETPAVETIPPPPLNPLLARFSDWWSSNRWRAPYITCGWRAGLYIWLGEPAELDPDLWSEAEDVFGAVPDAGMDVTEWNRRMACRADQAA